MPLSVPIPSHRGLHRVTLMSCLEAFVRDEILDKDDAWCVTFCAPAVSQSVLTEIVHRHCPRCKKNRKATKKLSLSKLPPILVIHLKRFSFHGPFSDKVPLAKLFVDAETREANHFRLSRADRDTGALPADRTRSYELHSAAAHGQEERDCAVWRISVRSIWCNEPLREPQQWSLVRVSFSPTFTISARLELTSVRTRHSTAFVRNGRDWHNIGDSKVTPCDPNVVQSVRPGSLLSFAYILPRLTYGIAPCRRPNRLISFITRGDNPQTTSSFSRLCRYHSSPSLSRRYKEESSAMSSCVVFPFTIVSFFCSVSYSRSPSNPQRCKFSTLEFEPRNLFYESPVVWFCHESEWRP